MIANLLINLLGILIFLFIFWKKQKEDYASEIIFLSGFYILLGLMLGLFSTIKFFPQWFFWGGVVGVLIGLAFAIFKLKIRSYEALEASVIGFMPWLSIFFLGDSVRNSSLTSFIAFLLTLLLIFVYYFLDLHYKEFSWYRSGRIGFSGLVTIGIFFLIRSATSIFFSTVLSFGGKYEPFISGILAFTLFLLVYNLGRREV